MDVNTWAQQACMVSESFQPEDISRIVWPPCSLDLNLTETMLDALTRARRLPGHSAIEK